MVRTRRRFASDLLNLTLAGPDVNRNRKKHHDAAQWMPSMNRCWFAARVVEVRHKYALTVDTREANALERVLSACTSTGMVVRSCEAGRSAAAPKAPQSVPSSGTTDALHLWDDNGNGRITCREARPTGSPRCRVAIRPIRPYATATVWSASNDVFLLPH